MIEYNFTQEDITFVEKAIELKKKNFYIDSTQLTEVYNRVLNKRVAPTNCGSCLRQRITELEGVLLHFKASEAKKAQELDNIKEDKNKAVEEAGNAPKPKRKKKA